MSSHILTELEGACDYLLFVDGGRVRLGGEAEDIVSAHVLLTGQARDLAPHTVVESRTTGRQLTALWSERRAPWTPPPGPSPSPPWRSCCSPISAPRTPHRC